MGSLSSTSLAVFTTPGSHGTTGRIGSPRCTWQGSMQSKCKLNTGGYRNTTLSLGLSFSTFAFFFNFVYTDMCPGTIMRQYMGCTTSQGTETWSIS